MEIGEAVKDFLVRVARRLSCLLGDHRVRTGVDLGEPGPGWMLGCLECGDCIPFPKPEPFYAHGVQEAMDKAKLTG